MLISDWSSDVCSSDLHELEGRLLRALAEFPRVVASAAELREPHRIARFLEDTTSIFNKWYDTRECRMPPPGDEPVTALTESRRVLVHAAPTALATGLTLPGDRQSYGPVERVSVQ